MLGPSRVGAWAIRGLAIDPSSCSLSRCVRSSAAFSHMVIMRSRRHVAMGHRRLGLQSMDRLFQRKNFLRLAAEPPEGDRTGLGLALPDHKDRRHFREAVLADLIVDLLVAQIDRDRSEEHTSELQSLMRISYAVFCLKKK